MSGPYITWRSNKSSFGHTNNEHLIPSSIMDAYHCSQRKGRAQDGASDSYRYGDGHDEIANPSYDEHGSVQTNS